MPAQIAKWRQRSFFSRSFLPIFPALDMGDCHLFTSVRGLSFAASPRSVYYKFRRKFVDSTCGINRAILFDLPEGVGVFFHLR